MSETLESLQALQPVLVERQQLEHVSQWPARQRCVFRECRFPTLQLSAERLSDIRFERCEFGDLQIEGGQLDQVVFDRCTVQRLQAQGSQWSQVSFQQCELGPWTWRQMTAKGVHITGGRAQTLDCADCIVRYCSLVDAALERLQIHGGHWQDLSLANVRAASVDMAGVRLRHLLWGRTQIGTVTLVDCAAQTLTWFDCLMGRLQATHLQASNASWQDSEIASGRLDGCALPMALLAGCRLKDLTFADCDLTQALFEGARLEDCDLRGLRATRASLRRAELSNVDLSGADLSGLNATEAKVHKLRLSGTRCCDGILHGQPVDAWAGADLDGAEFNADPALDDSLWWLSTRLGPREGTLA